MNDHETHDDETSGTDDEPHDDAETMNWEELARRNLSRRTTREFDDRVRVRFLEATDALDYDGDGPRDALMHISDGYRAQGEWVTSLADDLVTAGVFDYKDPEWLLLTAAADTADALSTVAMASAHGNPEGGTDGVCVSNTDRALDALRNAERHLAGVRDEGTDPHTGGDHKTLQDALADESEDTRETAGELMDDDARDRVARDLEETAHEWEGRGYDREGVAQMLEHFADVVRDGYTELPENRGEWWRDVHADGEEEA